MASQDGKIRKDDLVESGALKVYDELKTKATSTLKAIATALDKLSKAESKAAISTEKHKEIELKRNAELKKAISTIKQLETANKKLADTQKENINNTKKQTKANKTLSGTFKNLLKSVTAFIGVRMFIQAIKDTFNLIKSLDSLGFAMKAIIKDSNELGQTQEWLKKITNAFGAELVTTTERYIKFRAASIQAGLSAKETQKIFETMTKAAGVLGLKTDELRGIYLALEQMISKGKITTEELRRQLGERLPGAMDIMAKSLGVTTAELDNMMKKGQVITKDVLPGFAEEIEKAFGIQSVTKVDTLMAAQIRLQNAWTNLIKDMNGDQGVLSDAFTGILNFTTAILESLTEISDVMKEAFKTDVLKRYETSVGAVKVVYNEARRALETNLDLQSRYSASIEAEAARQSMLKGRLKEVLKDRFLERTVLEEINKVKTENIPLALEELAFLDDISRADKKYIALQAVKIRAAQDVKNETFDAMTVEITARARVVDVIDEEIKKLQQRQTAESKNNANWVKFEKDIKKLQEERLDITGRITKENEKALFGSIKFLDEAIAKYKEILDTTTDEGFRLVAQDQIKKIEDLKKSLLGVNEEIQELAATKPIGIDIEIQAEKFKMSADEILDIAGEFNNTLGGLFDAVSDRRLEQIDYEIQAEETKYDRLLELAENDKAQQESVQREKDAAIAKLEKKRLKEEQKAAKRRKAMAVAEIAINTARAIIGIWADFPKVDFGATAAIATGVMSALGAVQIATVLAQPIPKFAEGGTMGWDGKALINDGGNREFVERNGAVFSSPIKNAVVDLQKGDIIHKDMDALMNASIMTSLANDNKNLDSNKLKLIFDNNYNGLEKTIKNGFRNANVNNNIKLNGFDHSQQAYGESMSRWN